MSHPGIRIRVSTPAGVVLEGDSDFLHYAGKWSHGITEGEWHQMLQHVQDGVPLLTIELAPVTLEDTVVPDDLSALGDSLALLTTSGVIPGQTRRVRGISRAMSRTLRKRVLYPSRARVDESPPACQGEYSQPEGRYRAIAMGRSAWRSRPASAPSPPGRRRSGHPDQICRDNH